MVAEVGCDLWISYDSGMGMVVVVGARIDSLIFNNEVIDIIDKDDVGVWTYLDDIGVKSMSFSCTGVATVLMFFVLAVAASSGMVLYDF